MDADSIPGPDEPLSAEGFALIGAAFEVHNTLGGGLLEDIYQEALEIELQERDLEYVAKPNLPAFYKDHQLTQFYQPDLYAFQAIVVELKSVTQLSPAHEAQLLNYMRLSRKPIGYLINFAPISGVEWKRFILRKFLS